MVLTSSLKPSNSSPRGLRNKLYAELESHLDSEVLSFVTSERRGMDTRIDQDCIEPFVDILDQIGTTQRISLILHTSGGDTLAAWRLINLLRMFCTELHVLIPSMALSAGTLIALGADRVTMTRQAVLGPIDPSISELLNPQAEIHGQSTPVPVSVESVRGYFNAARDGLGINDSEQLTEILVNLTNHVHPLVLGSIFRTEAQIRLLARKLLSKQIDDVDAVESIVDFFCSDSGSHDYTINRKEAIELGLKIAKPSDEIYDLLRNIHLSFMAELKVFEPYTADSILHSEQNEDGTSYSIPRGFVESTRNGDYTYLSEGSRTFVRVRESPPKMGIKDSRSFEGWRKQEKPI